MVPSTAGGCPPSIRTPPSRNSSPNCRSWPGVADVHRSQVASDDATTTDSLRRGRHVATYATPSSRGPRPATNRRHADVSESTRWGNFELIKKVGEGTFGEVFLARDLWLGHDVALKLLKANVGDRARMLQEARMLVRVRHLNVVMVHGADVHGGRLGFWMDFIEGSTLHDAIHREGPRSASEALAWGQDLCRALAAVHNAGIVHRDVKAQNVMRRTSDGRLVLMDFGAGEILGASRGGPGAGTPLYLAPELLNGRRSIPKLGHLRARRAAVLPRLAQIPGARHHLGRARRGARTARARAAGRRAARHAARPSSTSSNERCRPDPSHRYASAGEMLAAMRGGDDSGPLTLRSSGSLPTGTAPPSQLRQRLVQLAALVVGLFGFTLALGYVACRSFDSVLAVDPEFAAGPSDFLTVGREAAFPFLVYWLAAAVILLALDSARQALPTRWVGLFRGWGSRWATTDPVARRARRFA